MIPPYDETEKEIIDNFKMEFESKKKECAVLIVLATSDPEKWTIAGFSDEREFRTVDPDPKLLQELKKQPRNERRIFELAHLVLHYPERKALMDIRDMVEIFEPQTEGQKVRYSATIQSLNDLSELRRMRVDAANDKLSCSMWTIIICGALMNIFTIYLFQFKNAKLHYVVVSLSSALLSFVLLIILLNNRPFLGETGIEPDSYTNIGWIMHVKGGNPFRNKDWQEACNELKKTSTE